MIRDMNAWEKNEEQKRGGWAEDFIGELKEKGKLSSGTAEEEKSEKVDKGKGKASLDDDKPDLAQASSARASISRMLQEFQPKEGDEGMDEMVSKALGIIFDAVKSMP